MTDFLKTWASRLAGSLAAVVAGWLTQIGITLAPEHLAGLENFLVGLTVGVALLAYSFIHKLIDKWLGNKDETPELPTPVN